MYTIYTKVIRIVSLSCKQCTERDRKGQCSGLNEQWHNKDIIFEHVLQPIA